MENPIFTQEEFDAFSKIGRILKEKLDEATKQSNKNVVNLSYIFAHCFTFLKEEMPDEQFQTFLKNSNIISEWFNAGLALNETLEHLTKNFDEKIAKKDNANTDQDLELRKKFNVDGNL